MPPAARALGLTLLLLLASAPAARAAAADWSVAPAGAGRPSFYAEGTPGTALNDTVSVTNHGRGPLTVRLRATGVRITFARTTLRVPARTRAEVPFTVAVPADAAPGDRAGSIAARDAAGRTATVAVRLRVGGPALSALTVEHVAVRGDRITYELVNRGTTVLVPRLAVHADGVLGPVLDRPARTLPLRLPPGTRRTLGEPWPGRPALDAVDLRLTATAAGGAHATAHASVRFVPWGPVSGALGAVAAGAALPSVRRHRRRREAARDGAPVRTGAGASAEPAGAVG
ncbi:COG1470 family protein [Streptomyces collinus]|uniref:COG1470 family protein n=1 Tax=Streptomyces collinus TaxID=42684 RepID=UPI0033316F9F